MKQDGPHCSAPQGVESKFGQSYVWLPPYIWWIGHQPAAIYPPASKYKSINLGPPCVLVGCSPPAELGNVVQPCEPFSVANNQLLVLDELRCGLRMVRVKWKHVNSVYLDPCAYIQDLLHLCVSLVASEIMELFM